MLHCFTCVKLQKLLHLILYSGKFSLVQNFVRMPPDTPEEIFMLLIFAKCEPLKHTPTKWLPRLFLNMCKPGTSQVSGRRSNKPSWYHNDGVFFSCRGSGQRRSPLQRRLQNFYPGSFFHAFNFYCCSSSAKIAKRYTQQKFPAMQYMFVSTCH